MPPVGAALPSAPALAAPPPLAETLRATPEITEEDSAASTGMDAHSTGDHTLMMLDDFHGAGDYSASAASSRWEPPEAAVAAPPRFRRRTKSSNRVG